MGDAYSDGFKAHDYLFKVVLCGDSGVGKTNILGRYTRGEFLESSPTTIGVEFLTKATTYEGKSLAIQIWDTAGQERFNSIARSYYRGSVGAFIVYDITKRPTFEHVVDRWLVQLKTHTHQSIVLCLLGNKCDSKDLREVTTEEGEALAQKHGLLFFEVSAKDATNVNKAFERMIVEIYNLVKKPTAAASASTADISASASQSSTARAPTLRGPDYFSESARGPQGSKTVDLKAPPPPPGANGESCAC